MLLSFVFLFLLGSASARVNCIFGDRDLGDAFCVEKYREGSVCAEDGFCSNPFRSGCLRNVKDTFSQIRTCNSDDDPGAEERGECAAGEYKEIRILTQNWEAPMFTAWVMQIVLSEVLGVPTSLETGKAESSVNFYDPEMRFAYSNSTYDYDALRTATEFRGCESFRSEQAKKGWYRSCADIMPEAWNGQTGTIDRLVKEGVLESSTGSGGVAKFSWFVPKFTAETNYQLLSVYGLQEGSPAEQRRRMAETFLRPRTWKFFCQEVSPDNCASPYYDDQDRLIATRPPADESEEGQFFSAGNYHGHFSASDSNDCDANPDCFGHIANPPCFWTNYVIPQLHHLGIPVWSDGATTAAGHYNYLEMVGIYHAANYTKSNVLLYWYTPDTMMQEYVGTDAEFTPIHLPPSTIECQNNRVTEEQRCSDNPEDWFGDKLGSCDSEGFPVQKLVAAYMYNQTYNTETDVNRSPAYRFIKAFRMNDLNLEFIYRRWYAANSDRWSYDNRDALCTWVGENFNMLQDFIPETFPRTEVKMEYNLPVVAGSIALAAITAVLVVAVAALVFRHRKRKVMVYAQPTFLYMILLGAMCVSIGAILTPLPPSSGMCMVAEWCVTIGYSFVLVPLIVKISAINKLFQSAARCERVKITPTELYKIIGAIITGVVVFLTVWSIMDPFTNATGKRLTGTTNAFGGQVVEVYDTCHSNLIVWFIVRFTYIFLLCVAATVLAVQTRKVRQEFRESIRLGHVIYAIFLVELLLILVWMLGPEQLFLLKTNSAAAANSYLLSASILIILSVYFYPKIKSATRNMDPGASSMSIVQKSFHTHTRKSSDSFRAATQSGTREGTPTGTQTGTHEGTETGTSSEHRDSTSGLTKYQQEEKLSSQEESFHDENPFEVMCSSLEMSNEMSRSLGA